MSRQVAHDVLRRMVSPPPPAPEDVPITSSRAMRLAITRAADKTHALELTVGGMREEVVPLDALIEMLSPDLMLVAMTEGGALGGLAGLDLQMRSALIEAQTVGKVLETLPDERAPTRTDAVMAVPFLSSLLTEMGQTTPRTPLDAWGLGMVPGGLVSDARAASLVLPERAYRVIRMTLDLRAGDREGELLIAMPDQADPAPQAQPQEKHGDWAVDFQAVVNAAPVSLRAQLHRFKLPLFAAENLTAGQVLPLPGCQVTSVKLLSSDGRKVATARLGQSEGMRAVRVETAGPPDMQPLDEISGTSLGDLAARDGYRNDRMVGDGEGGNDADNTAMMDMAAMDIASSADELADNTDQMLDDMEAALSAGPTGGDDTSSLNWDMEEIEGETEVAPLDWSAEGFNDADEN